MTWLPPSPEEQIQFLRNIQRLLAEGLTSSTYKFALLHALADLAVLKGDDTGAPLELRTTDIASRFVELYWRQCRPFQGSRSRGGLILKQNNGRHAAIVTDIVAVQKEHGGALSRLQQPADGRWSQLVSHVEQIVRVMPLWKLQRLGREQLQFLYGNAQRVSAITLKPGVAYNLRAFYPLLRDVIQGAWIRFVQQLNVHELGDIADLGTFLFAQERGSLEIYRPILRDVQHGNCLYCGEPLLTLAHVDHFIPWSRYPADLGHNLVLVHDTCNRDKSDHLGAEEHLCAWRQRNHQHDAELRDRLSEAGLPSDPSSSLMIVNLAYDQTEKAKGQVWVVKKMLRHLSAEWRDCLNT